MVVIQITPSRRVVILITTIFNDFFRFSIEMRLIWHSTFSCDRFNWFLFKNYASNGRDPNHAITKNRDSNHAITKGRDSNHDYI